MPQMALVAVAAGMQVAGTIAQSQAQRAQGAAQQQEANYVAAQQTQAAGQAQASGQRAAIVQQKQTDVALSNARAGAGTQGSTTTDPGIETNLQQIGTEGNYRAATAFYQGDAKAQNLKNQAAGSVYQGNLDVQTANTRANTTLMQGASSLFMKYASPFGGSGTTASDGNPAGAYTDDSGIKWNAYQGA